MKNPNYSQHEKRVIDVFNRHVAAFMAGDIDGVLSDFSEKSVVVTSDGVYEGVDNIRKVYNRLLDEFGNINRGDSPGIVIDVLHVRHDTLFITWHGESKHHRFPFGTDTFVCDGNKFLKQSIAFSEPLPRLAN